MCNVVTAEYAMLRKQLLKCAGTPVASLVGAVTYGTHPILFRSGWYRRFKTRTSWRVRIFVSSKYAWNQSCIAFQWSDDIMGWANAHDSCKWRLLAIISHKKRWSATDALSKWAEIWQCLRLIFWICKSVTVAFEQTQGDHMKHCFEPLSSVTLVVHIDVFLRLGKKHASPYLDDGFHDMPIGTRLLVDRPQG